MNSRWKGNSIIFSMKLGPTCSDNRIKIMVLITLRSQPRIKVNENLWVARVWCKSMKNVVLSWCWPSLTFGQPRVDQEHFGQFDLKRHFKFSDTQMGCATSIQMFPWPHRGKLIFLVFSGFGTQINDGQNTISICLMKGPYKILLW